MRLLSWNVNGRVAEGATRQIDAVLERAPDIVALQEVTLASYPSWCDALMDAGYSVASTVDLALAAETVGPLEHKVPICTGGDGD